MVCYSFGAEYFGASGNCLYFYFCQEKRIKRRIIEILLMLKNKQKPKKVIIGGTFDVLHKGHEALLRRAFGLGETTIGLTSNKMAEKRKKRKIRNFQLRKKDLEKKIKEKSLRKYKIIKIEDKFGPTLKEDFDYIVVSPATYKTALLVNGKRKKKGKKPIKIIKIKFVLGQNGKPVNATGIIKGRINKQGKLIKKHE